MSITSGSAPRAQQHISDDSVRDATGRSWGDWFAVLDAWGATARTHSE